MRALVVVWIALILAGVYGYISNIVDIINMVNDPITGMFILRCVGIVVFPLGAILGYF